MIFQAVGVSSREHRSLFLDGMDFEVAMDDFLWYLGAPTRELKIFDWNLSRISRSELPPSPRFESRSTILVYRHFVNQKLIGRAKLVFITHYIDLSIVGDDLYLSDFSRFQNRNFIVRAGKCDPNEMKKPNALTILSAFVISIGFGIGVFADILIPDITFRNLIPTEKLRLLWLTAGPLQWSGQVLNSFGNCSCHGVPDASSQELLDDDLLYAHILIISPCNNSQNA